MYRKVSTTCPRFELEHADTPFIDEDNGVVNPSRTEEIGPGYICPCCTEAYPKHCFKEVLNRHDAEKQVKEFRKNLNEYLEAVGKKTLDDQGGSLGPIAAQVVMGRKTGSPASNWTPVQIPHEVEHAV